MHVWVLIASWKIKDREYFRYECSECKEVKVE